MKPHQMFHIDGVTDLKVMERDANHFKNKSENTLLHHHRLGESCNDKCRLYKKED